MSGTPTAEHAPAPEAGLAQLDAALRRLDDCELAAVAASALARLTLRRAWRMVPSELATLARMRSMLAALIERRQA